LQVLNYTEILGRACHVAWSQRDADKRHNTGLNVYVKGLPAGTDARRLHAEFMRFGAIASVKVGKNASGEALPYGFVHFQDEEAGNEAIAAAAAPEGLKIDDCAVHVEVHKPNTGKNVEDDTNFTSVFVKNIPAAWAAEDLERRLAEFGAVSSATLLPRAAGRSCGFVYFVEHAAAAAAVAALPETPESKGVAGADAAVAELQCCRALSKAEVAAAKQAALEAKKMQRQVSNLGSNLYIKFLPENMTKDMLEAAFSPFGTVSSAKLVTDMAGEGTGVGYVCFSSPADATKALVAMQGAQLDPANPARKLYVALHIPKTLRVSPHRAQQQQHWKVHGRRAGRGRGLQTVQRPIPPIVYPYPQPPAPMPVPYPGHPHQHQQHQPGFGALAGMGIDAGAAADTGARSTEEERLRRIIASLASQLAAGSQK
jgi:polyadenylate-binding protein